MVNSAYITENCLPTSDLDRRSKTLSTAAAVKRSSLSPSLRAVLPQDGMSAPSQQAASFTNRWQQKLQIAKQSGYSQTMADMAACIGNTFNGDSCAIVHFEAADAPALTCWFADAPLLPMQPLKTSEPFEDWLADTAPIHCSDLETLRSPSDTPSGASKILEIWQFIQSLRAFCHR